MSTVIVLAAAVLVAAWVNRDLIRIKIASVYARVAPKPGAGSHTPQAVPAAFSGDAPWALSALPDCLTQVSESTGSTSYVRARLPRGFTRVQGPAHFSYGDCSIAVEPDRAYVRRGDDRFVIPPHVQFYRNGERLAMIREDANSVELRVYDPVQR